MSIFDFFKQKEKQLEVGETDGDYIGCYLFGIEGDDESPASYHSLATDLNTLTLDCREFFEGLAENKEKLVNSSPLGARHQQDLKVIINAINNLDMFINMHFKTNNTDPFLTVAGLNIFLRVGTRKREKINGKYIE